jgi:hypothetical protein
MMSIPLYHCTISFQSINICAEHDRTFILLLQKIYYLFLTSTKFHFKSLIDKFKT